MEDSDSHPALPAGGLNTRKTEDLNAALLVLHRDVRRIVDKVDSIDQRLSDGSTKLALAEQRADNHSVLIGQIQVAQNAMREEMRAGLKTNECMDCDERISLLEQKEALRDDRERRAEKRFDPPWWIVLVLTPVAGVVCSAATIWFLSGIAAHAKGAS